MEALMAATAAAKAVAVYRAASGACCACGAGAVATAALTGALTGWEVTVLLRLKLSSNSVYYYNQTTRNESVSQCEKW